MLIEDDDVLGFIIKEGLELTGDYEVLWINNSMQAINAFNEFYPDIVVSDIDMPGLNGLEIARKIKAIDSEIPIVLETCVSSSKVILEAYSIGIDNYIKKPFLPDELDAYVKGLLKRIRHQEEVKKDDNIIYLGNIEFNTKLQTLKTGTGTIDLTTREAALLELLYRNLDHLVTKETIA
jgi:DNA-binding response OmpR family regulator